MHDDTPDNTISRANKKDVSNLSNFGVLDSSTCGQATCQDSQVMQSMEEPKEEPKEACVHVSKVGDPQESSDAALYVHAVQVIEPDLQAKKDLLHKLGFPRRPMFWPHYDEACHEAYALMPDTFGVKASFLAQFASSHLDVVRIQKYCQTFWLSSDAHDLKFAYPDDAFHVDASTLDFWVFDNPGTPRIVRAKVDTPKLRETLFELKLFEGQSMDSIAYDYYSRTDWFVAYSVQVAYFVQLCKLHVNVVDLRGRGSDALDMQGHFARFQGTDNNNFVTSFYDLATNKWLATYTTPYSFGRPCVSWTVRKDVLVVSARTYETTMRQVDTFKDGQQSSVIVTKDQATQMLLQQTTK